MKKVVPMAALTALVSAWCSPQAIAADVTAAADINSAYVWRGLTFNDGIVVQPSIDIAANGFGLNVWGNLDIDDYDDTLDSGEFSEVDITASYAFNLGPVAASVGYIEYMFPAGGASTSEIFVTTGMDIGAGFSAGLELYYDIDQVDDVYATASIGYALDLNEKLGLELGGLISYAGEDFAAAYAGGVDGGFFNYVLSASLSYAITDALSAGASLNYTDSMDSDVFPDTAVDTNVYGGISIAYTF
ncbi:MAG: MltA-interacting MipA family protein [Desulfobacterales bacterium]|nr:MltA-interacting MipA family protein [Desulfobacterales bacterium]